jgi:LysM repeat protein
MQNFISAEYQRILQLGGQELANEFLVFVQNFVSTTESATKGALQSALQAMNAETEKFRLRAQAEYAKFKAADPADTAFAHTSGGVSVPVTAAAQNIPSLGLEGTAASEQIKVIAQAIPDQIIRFLHGLGITISRVLNDGLSKMGTSLQALLEDVSGRTVDIFGKTVEIAGGSMEAMTPGLQRLKEIFEQKMRGILDSAENGADLLIVDTEQDLERIRSIMGDAFNPEQYVVLETIFAESLSEVDVMGDQLRELFKVAQERLYEMRVSLGTAGRATLAASGPEGAAVAESMGQRSSGALVTGIRQTGLGGSFEEAKRVAESLIEELKNEMSLIGAEAVRSAIVAFQQGARQEGQTASDSKVTTQIGKDHSSGFSTGARSKKDEAVKAGEETVEAVAEGARRGGKGRARTAGPTTPGEPIQFDILNGKVVEASQHAQTFGQRLATSTTKVVSMGNKIGMVGIGLSSLVGMLGRIDGPLGDFASKLFPIISAMTGLSFALRMLNAETILGIGKRIDEAIAAGASAKATQAKTAADTLNAKITKINSDAKTQEVAISRKLTIANNQQAAASAAATRGLAAMTATSMAMGGGQAGTAVGNIAGKGVAAGSLAISKSQRLLNLSMLKLNRGTLVLGRGFGKFGATIGRVASGILGAIRGLVVGIMKLLGPVGLVVAGFALLAGGIFLLTKVINDQSAKVKGLGDAANLSTKKLETLNSILGTNLQRQEFVGVGAVGSGGTGAQVSGGASAAEEVSSIQQQLLESDEFKEDYKGIIAGIKGATDQAATDALTSMAVTLQTAGASDEMIAGIVNAILIEAGKTELVLDFKEISIADATQAADSAVQAYSEAIERSRALTGRHGDGLDALAADPSRFVAGGNNVSGSVGSIGGSATQEAREAAAGSLASAIQNANIQFAQGKITLEEYNQALADVDQSILGLAQEGATGIAEATLLIGTMIQKLEEAGLTGVGKEVESLLQQGTESGIASASAIVQARAADPTGERIQISDDDRAVLDAGAAVSASAAEKAAAEELTERIKDQTVALVENNRVKTEAEDAEERSKAFASELDTQNDALRDQIDTYTNVSEAIKNNTDIENKNALAHKIASDETLRQEFALAQQADAYNKNTNAVDAFVAGLTEQGALQDELAAKQATAGLEIDISTLEKQIETYDSALASASGLVDETEAQAIAYKISADAALQQAFAVAQATDAANGNTDATAALINNLAIEAELRGKIADISGVASGTGRGGGGRSGPEASALDSITKKIKLFGNAQASVTKGWEASMKAILDFANVAGNLGGEFNGLNKQLRGLDLNENLIEMITGMDPDEYEKRKNDLFIFDDKGTIIGMTDKLSQLNDALNTVLIGEFIDAQNQITNSVSNQITAINKLTAAGASYEAAYRAVQNTAFAAAVATATSAAQIKAAANAAMDAQRMMDRMAKRNEEEQRVKGISDAVKQMNKDFSNQAKILDYINRNRSNLREAQIQEILSDKNLAALILEPNINPGALATALDNAAKREQLELSIKKLTITGQEEIFRDGMGKAMDAFSAQTQKIEFEFEAKMKNEKDIIKKAEEQLALLQFELSTYEADLKDIEFQEEEINKAYEKRFDALDQIAQANEDIVRQQQAQLDVADALSRGDIAAAARAVREARVAAGEAAREQERRRLEDAQRAQLGALVSTRGLTRAQAEEMSLEIEKQIFEIERDRLNPAQELVRLAELKKEADIESLTVLEKTRQEYEKMANRIDLAKAGNWKTVEAMQEALDIVEKLVEELGKSKPLPPPPPPPPPPPARSSGGSSKPAPAPPPQTYTVKPGDWLSKIAPAHGISTAALIAANPQIKNPNLIFPGQQINIPKKATGGMIIPKRMAGGGPAYPVRRMAGGSMVKGYPLGGLIPYSSVGGPFPSLGSDTIPAMLTPGEFVIRRPAVREIGVDKLESLNRNATMGGDVYNYSLSVNVKSESNPDQIARTVMDHIKRVDSQRIRGNRY